MSRSVSGLSSILYCLKPARRVEVKNYAESIKSKNTCKTCALGIGRRKGGMVNVPTFFPENNVLIPAETDPQSKTPVYKSVKVSIIPAKNNSKFQ